MKAVFLLLALLGAATALRPGFEYHYKYNGRVATGLQELKEQFAAAGIMIDVTVQMVNPNTVKVQLNNMQAGDFNDELEYVREPVPISYSGLREGAQFLQEPFVVNMETGEFKSMLVDKDEPVWVTNIRKSIVNIFTVRPLDIAYGGRNWLKDEPMFSVMQNGLEGRCRHWYTLINLPEDLQAEEEMYLHNFVKEDAEHGTINDKLYVLRKDISFDDCESRVIIQHLGNPNLCKDEIGSSQCEEYMSRSVTGKYILRGDEKGMRIERALIEGEVIVNTFDLLTDRASMHTVTNQTLQLESVKKITTEMQITVTKEIPHLHFEVLEKMDTTRYPTVEEIVTGIEVTKDKMLKAKEHVKEIVRKYESSLTTTVEDQDLVGELDVASVNLALLTEEEINNLYKEITEPKQKKLYIRLLTSTGSKPAVQFLLKMMIADQTFRKEHGMDFFTSMVPAIRHPSLVEPIMKFVMNTLKMEEDPALESHGVLNLAHLINNACLSPKKHLKFAPWTEQEKCDKEMIKNSFIPYLQKNILERSRATWSKLVYVQALSTLHTHETFDVLKTIILGTEEQDPFVRGTAIVGLLPMNKPIPTMYEEVMLLLNPIYENFGEHPIIRQKAFLVMAYWKPSASWWSRMALATHHEPDMQVLSFVLSTMKFFAEDEQGVGCEQVRMALPMARPLTPKVMSMSQQRNIMLHLKDSKINGDYKFMWMTNSTSVTPHFMIFHVMHRLHEEHINTLRTGVFMKNMDEVLRSVMNIWQNVDEDVNKRPISDLAQLVYKQIKDKLHMEVPEVEADAQLIFFTSYMDTMSTILPITMKLDPTMLANPMKFLDKIPRNMPIDYKIFQKPIQMISAMPNNLGLPMIFSVSKPVVATIDGAITLSTPSEKKLKADFDMRAKMESKRIFKVRTLLPFFGREIVCGFESHYTYDLPIAIHLNFDIALNQFQINFQPSSHVKTGTPMYLSTGRVLPYTMRREFLPDTLPMLESDFKIVKSVENKIEKEECEITPTMFLHYEGEDRFPYNFSTIYKTFSSLKLKEMPRLFVTPNKYHLYKLKYVPKQVEEGKPFFTIFYDGKVKTLKSTWDMARRNVELTVNFDAEEQAQRVVSKAQLAYNFLDLPQESFCLRIQSVSPRILSLFSVKEILEGDIKTTYKGELFVGKDSCQGHNAAITMEGEMDLTPEAKIKEEKSSKYDQYRTPEIVVLTNPLYDRAHFRFNWIENVPMRVQNFTYHFFDYVWGSAFPKVQSNYLNIRSQDKQVIVEMKRNLKTERLDILVQTPREQAEFKDLKFPPRTFYTYWPFHRLFSPMTIKDTIEYEYIQDISASRCTVTENEIYTFDGVLVQQAPSNCYTVLAMDTLRPTDLSLNAPDFRQFLVQAKKTGKLQARIVVPKAGITLEVTNRDVKMNGSPLSIDERTGLKSEHYEIYRMNNAVYVKMFVGVSVKVSDKIEVKVSNLYKSHVHGICGDMDGEWRSDLVDPKGCILQDPASFLSAWTVEEGCNPAIVMDKKFEALNECPKHTYIPTGVSHQFANTKCTEWKFEKRQFKKTEGRKVVDFDCESVDVVPVCKSSCRPTMVDTTMMEYRCENKHAVKDTRTPAVFFTKFAVEHPTYCVLSQ